MQGGELEATDTMAPFDVAVRILDNQLRSLMWIDEKVRVPFFFTVCSLIFGKGPDYPLNFDDWPT